MLQEEETTQGVQDKNDSSEVGWEDSEFQSLEDIQPLEQPSISDLIYKHTNEFRFIIVIIENNFFLHHVGVPSGNNKYEEAKRKREERKLARQRQMEAKRAVKLRANPAAKKI